MIQRVHKKRRFELFRLCEWCSLVFKLTIASVVWDKVVKTGRRFQNFMKEIDGQCFFSRLKRGHC